MRREEREREARRVDSGGRHGGQSAASAAAVHVAGGEVRRRRRAEVVEGPGAGGRQGRVRGAADGGSERVAVRGAGGIQHDGRPPPRRPPALRLRHRHLPRHGLRLQPPRTFRIKHSYPFVSHVLLFPREFINLSKSVNLDYRIIRTK